MEQSQLTIQEIAKAAVDRVQSDQIEALQRALDALTARVSANAANLKPTDSVAAEVAALRAELAELKSGHAGEVALRQKTDEHLGEVEQRVIQADAAIVSHEGNDTVIRLPDGGAFRITPQRGSVVFNTDAPTP